MSPGRAFDALVHELCADGRVTTGKIFGHDALKVGGKVFASDHGSDLVLKLGRERVDELVAARTATRFDPMGGRPMKDWAQVSEGTADWLALAEEAKALVASLEGEEG